MTHFKKIEELEVRINKNFYYICGVVTVLAMVMMAIEFFSRSAFPPTEIGMFYLGILLLYSLHKEFVRWMREGNIKRQGEYFVYGWIAFTTALYVINFLAKDFFGISVHGTPSDVLKEACILTVEVLIIFLITRISKLVRICLLSEKKKK